MPLTGKCAENGTTPAERWRGVRRRLFPPLLFIVLQTGFLSFAGAAWWAVCNNSLYGRGAWIVGKDEGKFVFQTYEFMFRPLKDSMVRLNASMGFQEILYREPEDASRRLTRLRAECAIGSGGYLWIILRKGPEGLQALRISRWSERPSGFFRFGSEGDLLHAETFNIPDLENMTQVDLRFEPGTHVISINGAEIRRIADPSPAVGRFGFRGCGNVRVLCGVKNIRMDFEDPQASSRRWSVTEKFNTRREIRRLLPPMLLVALMVLGLRAWRRWIVDMLLAPEPRGVFHFRDDIATTGALAGAALAAHAGIATAIPFSFLAAEASTWILLAASRRGAGLPPTSRSKVIAGLAFAAVGLLLVFGATGRHGRFLGRHRMASPGNMSYVHLDALLLDPPSAAATGPFRLDAPVTVMPGRPLFVPGRAYRGQRIRMAFVPDANTTLDLVFHQQTFRTRGDPNGEPILYQRRTLRLTTRADAASGLSPMMNTRVNPVYRMNSVVIPGETNTLELTSGPRGVTLRLNGELTEYPGIQLLARGETGVMVFENSVRIETLDIVPLEAEDGASPARDAVAWLWPFAIAVTLLWPVNRRDWLAHAGLCAAAAFPILLYFAGAWFLSPGTLFFLGAERVLWMDLLLVSSMVAYLGLVLLLRPSCRAAPVAFNLAAIALIVFTALTIWDHLPDDHRLKSKWQAHVILPAGEPAKVRRGDVPWYADNRRIGANTYMIHQQFGGRTIAMPKPPGSVRIFGLGGSQAWGSGAADSSSTFYALLGQELVRNGLPVEMLNAGVNGKGIPNLLVYLREILVLFEPDVLIMDIGLNDSAGLRQIRSEVSRDRHRMSLLDLYRQILDFAAERGIDVILCQEPMSWELPLRPDTALYDGLADLTRRAGGRVISPQAVLREAEASAFVWWDTAHLAPHGHVLLARLLAPETESVVRCRLSRSASGVKTSPP